MGDCGIYQREQLLFSAGSMEKDFIRDVYYLEHLFVLWAQYVLKILLFYFVVLLVLLGMNSNGKYLLSKFADFHIKNILET